MAKLITKFKYLKPSARQSVGGYAKYIATREGVEKVDDTFKTDPSTEKQKKLIERILRDFPDSNSMLEYEDYLKEPTLGNASEFITRALEDNANEALNTKTYADYIATRPRAERFGSHGLFTDDGVRVKLEDVSRELNEYEGNVWTVIISLRREDAERLGFNSGERWRDMLRTQTETIAKNFKIPVEDLKWYAAFHNESHHPHVHLMVYSSEQAKPYLTQKGIMNLRSAFAKDVFADDLLSVYEKQTEHRNALRAQSRDVIAEIVSRINSGAYDNPVLENKLLELADRLSKTSGKKQYGYLKTDVKAVLSAFGFERSDLKTLNFNIETEYESYKDKGTYKQRFVGYKFRHMMKVEFLSDNDLLGKVLFALANCPVKPEFRLSYTVSDPEAAKNELLGKAVTDAKDKAAVLTQAAGVTLKGIQSIDYSWGEIDFEYKPMNGMLMADECLAAPMAISGTSYDMDIEPDDIEASDTVTVLWEIE